MVVDSVRENLYVEDSVPVSGSATSVTRIIPLDRISTPRITPSSESSTSVVKTPLKASKGELDIEIEEDYPVVMVKEVLPSKKPTKFYFINKNNGLLIIFDIVLALVILVLAVGLLRRANWIKR